MLSSNAKGKPFSPSFSARHFAVAQRQFPEQEKRSHQFGSMIPRENIGSNQSNQYVLPPTNSKWIKSFGSSEGKYFNSLLSQEVKGSNG